MSTDAFRRYVDRAREGKLGLWRLAAGIVLVLVVWALVTIVALTGAAVLAGRVLAEIDPRGAFDAFLATPAGVAAALATFLGMAGGVWLALKLVDRRSFGTVLGATGRFAWGDFWRGLAASLIASGLAEIATFFVDPSLERSAIGLGEWFLWLAPLTALLFVQVSAEELAFRGYLMQSLAARFRSPLVWALIPIVLFTILHWDSLSSPTMKAAMLVSIAAFAVLATALVVQTGNLGAGTGAHLGLNLFGIVVVSHMSWLPGGALFASEPLDTGSWSPVEAVLIALSAIASFALMGLALLHPGSPLKVRGA
jgi:membrane protease YdiL (CAAX protease family)